MKCLQSGTCFESRRLVERRWLFSRRRTLHRSKRCSPDQQISLFDAGLGYRHDRDRYSCPSEMPSSWRTSPSQVNSVLCKSFLSSHPRWMYGCYASLHGWSVQTFGCLLNCSNLEIFTLCVLMNLRPQINKSWPHATGGDWEPRLYSKRLCGIEADREDYSGKEWSINEHCLMQCINQNMLSQILWLNPTFFRHRNKSASLVLDWSGE